MDIYTSFSNATPLIKAKVDKPLHTIKNHPLEIIKRKIYDYFAKTHGDEYEIFENFSPYVDIVENFDKLLLPKDHPARSKSDTYYVNENTVLRTHTSAHQNQLLAQGKKRFLVTGNVFRKDEINRSHYPVFHQMEGVSIVPKNCDPKESLIETLGGLVECLFPGCEYRVNDDYFPFTEPSFEVEVMYNGEWLEILGSGVVHPKILENNNLTEKYWAFGLGLERLAMILFDIPDIRYFWSDHPKFIDQFASGEIVKFKPYSELENVTNDISFWIPKECIVPTKNETGEMKDRWNEDNDFYEIVREIGGDWVESVKCKDEFFHPKKQKHSRMYRIIYSPNDPELKNPSTFRTKMLELNEKVRNALKSNLNIELR